MKFDTNIESSDHKCARSRSSYVIFVTVFRAELRGYFAAPNSNLRCGGATPQPEGQIDSDLQKSCQAENQSETKIFRFIRKQSGLHHMHPVPTRGASAIVTNVGRGCGGREGCDRRSRLKRTAKTCGPDVQRFFALGENSRNPCELRVSGIWRPAPRFSRNRAGPY